MVEGGELNMTERIIPGIQKLIGVEVGVRHQMDLKQGHIQPNSQETKHLWRARKKGRLTYTEQSLKKDGPMCDVYS